MCIGSTCCRGHIRCDVTCNASVLLMWIVLPVYCSPSGWPVSLLEQLGLSSLVDKWPKEILPLAAPVGPLTAR